MPAVLRKFFLLAAKGEIPGYGVKDVQKLLQLALDFGLDVENMEITGYCR